MSWIEIYSLAEARKKEEEETSWGGYDKDDKTKAPRFFRSLSVKKAGTGHDEKSKTNNSMHFGRVDLDTVRGKADRAIALRDLRNDRTKKRKKSRLKSSDGWYFRTDGYLTPGKERSKASAEKLQAKIAARKKLGESTSWMEMYLLSENDVRDQFQRDTSAALTAGNISMNPRLDPDVKERASVLGDKLTRRSLHGASQPWRESSRTKNIPDRTDWNPNLNRTRSAGEAGTGHTTLAASNRLKRVGGKREPEPVGKMDLPHVGGDNPHKEEGQISDPEISPKELLPEPGSEPKQAAPAPQAPEGHKEGQPWPSEDCIERMKKRHGEARTQLMLQKYQEKLDKQAAKGEEH